MVNIYRTIRSGGRRTRGAARILAISLCLLCLSSQTVAAYAPYDSFIYAYRNGKLERAQCPAPFTPEQVIVRAGDSRLGSPADIAIDDTGNIFVADSTNNRIVKYSPEWETLNIFDGARLGAETDPFSGPQGVFVTAQGDIYVADTDNHRVVVMDSDGNWKNTVDKPESDIIKKGYVFSPRKLAVAEGNRLLVAAAGQTDGIMEFTAGGAFIGFLGSNLVSVSSLELLWRQFMTRQQREQASDIVPMEYANLCLDDEGFVYAVTKATDQKDKIRRLNIGGKDVLIRSDYMYSATEFALIEDICSDPYGNYYFLDSKDGRIYAYNSEGYLLYAFGSLSDQLGTFSSPSAIEYADGKLYVCDAVGGSITVFAPTEYAKSIETAFRHFRQQEYEESRAAWEETLRQNCNFEIAYIQIGRILYRGGRYEEAMDYFVKGNYRGNDYVSGYGKAFENYRTLWLQKNLSLCLSVTAVTLAAAVILIFVFWAVRKRKKPSSPT